MTIPAKEFVDIIPGVVGTGGNPLSLNGMILSEYALLPLGAPVSFPSKESVGTYFGLQSAEYEMAQIYFTGFENCDQLPSKLWFVRYNDAAISAFLIGGKVSTYTLAQLQGLSGSLTVSIDGSPVTAASINLSAATSFSNAASIIATALGADVDYDSQQGAFVISSGTTGASSTIGFATGTIAAGLKLTAVTGAKTSQGAAPQVPATFMTGVTAVQTNWANFSSTFEPDLAGKQAFAAWTNLQEDRYCYVPWDTDPNAIAQSAASFGALNLALGNSGTYPVYDNAKLAAFAMGIAASVNYNQPNGRVSWAFRTQSGFAPTVTDLDAFTNAKTNGYNFYCDVADNDNIFNFMFPGQISGPFKLMGTYQNQIFLNSQFSVAVMTLLTTIKYLPYNNYGYTLLRQTLQDPINQALLNGSIQVGVPLSAQQASIVNAEAGLKISDILTTQGYYLQILPASAQVRGQNGSPPMTFWYMDGGEIHQVVMGSIVVL